jgi:signal transduction histidine kinase
MLADLRHFRDITRTSAFRLTATLGAVFAVGIVALLSIIYVLTVTELTARSDYILQQDAHRLLAGSDDTLPERVRSDLRHDDSGLNYYALISASGDVVIGNVPKIPAMVPGHAIDVDGDPGKKVGPYRLLATRTRAGELLLIGRDITQIHDLRQRVLLILVWSGLTIAVGVVTAAVMLSLGPIRRVRGLQGASREIAAGDLQVRMPIAGRGDELDQFAGTVNVMVEEVGRVVAQVKGVTDAIAHDLRTPLTRVRAALYRVAQDQDVTGKIRRTLETTIADMDIVLDRFAALLRISELEAGSRKARFARVDLCSVAERACDLYEPLAEERGITLAAHLVPAEVYGDEKLLFEAVSNLIDNAIKFCREGGVVDVRVERSSGTTVLEVTDNGPGIAPDQREAVLRRFHRGAEAANVPGSGLGLSVVVAILHLHGFTLELLDAGPGLRARITATAA